MKPLSAPRLADRWIFGGLLLLLVWLPLPWGSNRAWAVPLAGVLVFALLGAWLWTAAAGAVKLPRFGQLRWPLLLWLLWIGWIALQLWPLEEAALSPELASALAVHLAVGELQQASPLMTRSIAPGVTLQALLLTITYFGLYLLVVLTVTARTQRMRLVLGAIVLSGLFQALYGSLMMLSGLEFGFLEVKAHYRGYATGTFVNRNHLAGYLELAAAAGIGLILADLRFGSGGRSWRARISSLIDLALSNKVLVRIALAFIVIGVVLTRSRMGNTALFTSLGLCGFGFVLVRQRAVAGKAAILFLSLLLVDLLIVSRWFGLEQVVERIEQTEVATEGRARLLDEMPPLIEQYRERGSGLGTFALAYAPLRKGTVYEYFDHAHNDYVEFLVETGMPGLGLVLLLAGAHYLHAIRVIVARRRRLAPAVCFAAWMGLTAYAIHGVVEFNLHIPANAATLVALMALAACCTSRSRGRTNRTPPLGDSSESVPAPTR